MKHLNLWLIIAYLIFNLTATSQAEQRLALVIGNAAYLGGSELRNPVNDAKDLAKVLRHLGFKVILKTNLNQQQMYTVVSQFGQKLRSDKENVGLFYFSGHGVQHNGENYLMPIGAMNSLDSPEQLYYRTLNANYVLDEMKAAKNQMNIVILDACRYNIFRSKFKGKPDRPGDPPLPEMNDGLAAPKQTPSGFLIAYATAANNFANDFSLNDDGSNSPYVKHLMCQMQKHNLIIEQMFKQVRVAVKAETNGLQEPAYYAAIDNDFFFVPKERRIEAIQGCETSFVCPECSQLLPVCERHFQAHRLTSGAGGTALSCYKKVLEKEPSNTEALAGLDKIEARYVTWIEAALSEGKKDKAKQYLEGLHKVNPESPILAALEERIYPKPLPLPKPLPPTPVTPLQVDTTPSVETPSFFEKAWEISSGLGRQIVSVWQAIVAAVIVIPLIWIGWRQNWLGAVIAWGQALNLEWKMSEQLSPWNPLDHLRLLWWILIKPQRLKAYRKIFGKNDEKRVGKWLLSTLTWFPLLVLTLALGLEFLPPFEKASPLDTYLWDSALLVGCWLLTGWLGDIDEYWVAIVAFVVAGVVAGVVAFDVAGVMAVGVPFGVTGVVAFDVAFIVAFFVVGNVAFGVTFGVVVFVGLFMFFVMFSGAFSAMFGLGFLVGVGVALLVVAGAAEAVEKSLETGTPSFLAHLTFLLLLAAHLFLIWFSFLDGWRQFA
jgi:hypothetical protein